MAKKSSAAQSGKASRRSLMPYIGWAILAGIWGLVVAALVSYDPADYPGNAIAPHNPITQNWAGQAGAWVAHELNKVAGPGIWIAVVSGLAMLVALARRKIVDQLILRVIGVGLMMVATSCIIGLLLGRGNFSLLRMALETVDPIAGNRPEGTGGLLAIFINGELVPRFGVLGALMMQVLSFWIGAILAVDQMVMLVPRMLGWMFGRIREIPVPRPVLVGQGPSLAGLARLTESVRFWSKAPQAEDDLGDTATLPRKPKKPKKIEDVIDEDAGGLGATESFDPDKASKKAAEDDSENEDEVTDAERDGLIGASDGGAAADDDEPAGRRAEDEVDEAADEEDAVADAPAAYLAEKAGASPREFDPEALRAKIKKLPINFAPRSLGKNAPPREVDLSGYQFPATNLLSEPESNFSNELEQVVRDQAMSLESSLRTYRIEGEVVGIDSGPVITLFEVRLKAGTKVNSIQAISSDVARSLKAPNIRIVPNTAGKDTIGIEVPNNKKEKVRLKELMTANPDSSKMKLPMFLGKDASGNPLIQDLTTMPHMLIAGTTGSGKSVCMNSIIMSLIFTRRPDELKMVLVDPKMVEMSMFKDIPHLMCPVVTEMNKATAILEWATTKMDERYELLAEAGVRDIAGYNNLSWDELKERFNPESEAEEVRIPKKLPYLVFIIDELADLMMTNKEVEGFIVRLAQKARAVGIHLILATQRPQANVVTGLIKGNMPCRISFKVASGLDSRIVLDQKGAELLLGHGDMLFLSPRSSKLIRAQGTLVDDLEIRATVKFLKEVAEQNFEPQLVQLRPEAGDVDEEAAKDPLFDAAVRIVVETGRGSVSLLQRRLTIGYSRASRLIEAMASAGFLGDYKGSQAREVAITIEEWEAMKAQMEKDAAEAAALAGPTEGKEGAQEEEGAEGQEETEEEIDPKEEEFNGPATDETDVKRT